MSAGMAMRELRAAHAGLKKSRQLLIQARDNPRMSPAVVQTGWDSLNQAHRVMASIPRIAADDAVMTMQLSVQRYATALLVRLRRLSRNEGIGVDDDFGEEDEKDLD
jgi:hypothetical protein